MADQAEGSVLTGTPEAGASWMADFDEPVREHMTTKGYDGPESLAKAYINLEKAVGADKIPLPSTDSDILEWDGWQRLGTPEEAAGYELAVPEGFEAYDQGLSDWFRETAHATRLPVAQAQRLHDKFVERMMEMHEEASTAQIDQQSQWEGALKKEGGGAFDERIAAAKRAVRAFGSDELVAALDESGLGSHPDLVKAFVKIGMELGTGPQFRDAEQSGRFGTTPDMAKEEIAKIRSNEALYDKGNPEYKILNDRLTQLTELAYGTEVVTGAG